MTAGLHGVVFSLELRRGLSEESLECLMRTPALILRPSSGAHESTRAVRRPRRSYQRVVARLTDIAEVLAVCEEFDPPEGTVAANRRKPERDSIRAEYRFDYRKPNLNFKRGALCVDSSCLTV